MTESEYDDNFYAENEELTKYSPHTIFDIVLSILDINSLCDIGGGIGLWVKEFINIKGDNADLNKIICVDGNYVDESKIMVPKQCFIRADLEKPLTWIDSKFDMAMSLEVAEHLDPERADSFVEDLTKLSDTVLFSAAIKGQGGTHHVNEQYMDYWVNLFKKYGYEPFDTIRPIIQNNKKIPFWYRQNIMMFAKTNTDNYNKLSLIKNGTLTHTVIDEYYDWVLSDRNWLKDNYQLIEKEKNDLSAELELKNSIIEDKEKELSRTTEELNNITNEYNYYKSGFTFKIYAWVKRNILSRIKS